MAGCWRLPCWASPMRVAFQTSVHSQPGPISPCPLQLWLAGLSDKSRTTLTSSRYRSAVITMSLRWRLMHADLKLQVYADMRS